MTLSIINSIPTVSELQSYKIIAEVASNNPFWRKLGGNGNPETIVATILSVMLMARELGISPIQAISGGINNIQGKFEISARLMNQLIRKYGHKIAIRKCDDSSCIIWSKRKDTGEEREETYTLEQAVRAGLVKEGSAWKKVPSDMLFARCISRLARRLYPDCIGGCYIEGELQESINGNSIQIESLDSTTQTRKEIEQISEDINDKKIESIPLINSQQALELKEILEGCASDYRNQVLITLKKSSIDSFEGIPATLYERIKSAALKKREEFYKECSEGESSYQVEEMHV